MTLILFLINHCHFFKFNTVHRLKTILLKSALKYSNNLEFVHATTVINIITASNLLTRSKIMWKFRRIKITANDKRILILYYKNYSSRSGEFFGRPCLTANRI